MLFPVFSSEDNTAHSRHPDDYEEKEKLLSQLTNCIVTAQIYAGGACFSMFHNLFQQDTNIVILQ